MAEIYLAYMNLSRIEDDDWINTEIITKSYRKLNENIVYNIIKDNIIPLSETHR
jgi:hypothetical protein